jgi:hypothetical protein
MTMFSYYDNLRHLFVTGLLHITAMTHSDQWISWFLSREAEVNIYITCALQEVTVI